MNKRQKQIEKCLIPTCQGIAAYIFWEIINGKLNGTIPDNLPNIDCRSYGNIYVVQDPWETDGYSERKATLFSRIEKKLYRMKGFRVNLSCSNMEHGMIDWTRV